MCQLYQHPDLNGRSEWSTGASWILAPNGGNYDFSTHSQLLAFDDEMTSLKLRDGRIILYDSPGYRTYLASLEAEPGYGFAPVNLQPEQDNRVTSVSWTPSFRRRRSLSSSTVKSPLAIVASNTSIACTSSEPVVGYGEAPSGQRRKALEWGVHSQSSKLVLYETRGAYNDFNRGRYFSVESCYSTNLQNFQFDGIASSLVICGGRIRGKGANGSTKIFEIQVRQNECIDVQFDDTTINILSHIEFNVCGGNLDCSS